MSKKRKSVASKVRLKKQYYRSRRKDSIEFLISSQQRNNETEQSVEIEKDIKTGVELQQQVFVILWLFLY